MRCLPHGRKEEQMGTQIAQRGAATPSRRVPRTRPRDAAWSRKQNAMVAEIADHALTGGAMAAGPDATPEQAIDAYLEMLKRELLEFAQRV